MVKQALSLLLALVLLLQTFSRASVVVAFYANQSYISKNLCENRGKPQMLCCGKCLLRRKLACEDKKQKDAAGLKLMQADVLSSKSFYATVPPAPAPMTAASFDSFAESIQKGEPSSFFHPPGLAAC